MIKSKFLKSIIVITGTLITINFVLIYNFYQLITML